MSLNPVSGSTVSSGRDASALSEVSERFGGLGLSAALYASRIHWTSASRVDAALSSRGASTVTCSHGLTPPLTPPGGVVLLFTGVSSMVNAGGESTLRTSLTERVSSTSAGSVAVSRLRRANCDSLANLLSLTPEATPEVSPEPSPGDPGPWNEAPTLLPSSISITALYPSASWSKSPVPKPRKPLTPPLGESTFEPLFEPPLFEPFFAPVGLKTSDPLSAGGSSTRTSSSSTSSVSSTQLGSIVDFRLKPSTPTPPLVFSYGDCADGGAGLSLDVTRSPVTCAVSPRAGSLSLSAGCATRKLSQLALKDTSSMT